MGVLKQPKLGKVMGILNQDKLLVKKSQKVMEVLNEIKVIDETLWGF